MRGIQGHRKDSHMDAEPGANKPLEQGLTASGNDDIKYYRLLHRQSASLDLETAFKRITLSRDLKLELCETCKTEKCVCPAFTPGTPCSSVSSTPTNNSDEDKEIPELVENTKLKALYPPVQSPSDEEADREFAMICRAPVYYHVRSQTTHRRCYYIYNALDSFETGRMKRRRQYSPHIQGYPVEH